MIRRLVLLVVVLSVAVGVPAAQAAKAKKVKPLKQPSVAVKVLTADPVAVLQDGKFTLRLTAQRAASVRLYAYAGKKAIAPAKTYRIRARKLGRRTISLALSKAARGQLDACYKTKIEVVVKARGYGSPRLKTRRHTKVRTQHFYFACRNGKLVAVSASSANGGSGSAGGSSGSGSGSSSADGTSGGAGATKPGSGKSGGAGGAATPRYEVGVGAASIAPDADGKWKGAPVYLGGYGFGGGSQLPGADAVVAGRPATGILGEGPSVRAFVVGDGKTLTAIADIETQGWFTERRTDATGIIDIRNYIADKTAGKLPAERVIVQSDHSHSGADAMGVWGGVSKDFMEYMKTQTQNAILAAWFNRRPGNLYYGSTEGKDLLTNQFRDDPVNQSQDSDLRVLQARDDAGVPFATLLNFSAHSTVLGGGNTLISGDWPQAANRIMAQRRDSSGRPLFGAPVTMIGTFGRTQPNRDSPCPGTAENSAAQGLCKIDGYATEVVDRAQVALAKATPITGNPVVAASSYLIQDTSTNAPILGFSTVGPEVGSATGLPFNRSSLPPWQAGNVIGTITGTARIGDVLISSVPGEIYPQIALKVRDTVKGIRPGGFMTAGLADDQLGYIIAPVEAYPQPIRATVLTSNFGDQIQACLTSAGQTCDNPVDPIGNDNYFFNVSHTLGERVTCSLLRGADDVLGQGSTFWSAYERCPAFVNDHVLPPGTDIATSGPASAAAASHP